MKLPGSGTKDTLSSTYTRMFKLLTSAEFTELENAGTTREKIAVLENIRRPCSACGAVRRVLDPVPCEDRLRQELAEVR